MEKSEQISKACFRDIFDFDKAPPDSYSWPRIAALSVVYATDRFFRLRNAVAIVETAGFEAIHASDADEAVSRSAQLQLAELTEADFARPVDVRHTQSLVVPPKREGPTGRHSNAQRYTGSADQSVARCHGA